MEILNTYRPYRVCPDVIEVPEWGYKLKYDSPDALTIAYNKALLEISKKSHTWLSAKSGFLARVWTESKVFTWWKNPSYNLYITIHEIIDCINYGIKYTEESETDSLKDLYDYSIVYAKDNSTVVRMPISELRYDTIPENLMYIPTRVFHTFSPLKKVQVEKTDASIKAWKHQYYLEDCKVWTKRIGNMDVAEWRLSH